MNNKKTVFITGATGKIGHEGFKQFLKRINPFNIVVFIREKVSLYQGRQGNKKTVLPKLKKPSRYIRLNLRKDDESTKGNNDKIS